MQIFSWLGQPGHAGNSTDQVHADVALLCMATILYSPSGRGKLLDGADPSVDEACDELLFHALRKYFTYENESERFQRKTVKKATRAARHELEYDRYTSEIDGWYNAFSGQDVAALVAPVAQRLLDNGVTGRMASDILETMRIIESQLGTGAKNEYLRAAVAREFGIVY